MSAADHIAIVVVVLSFVVFLFTWLFFYIDRRVTYVNSRHDEQVDYVNNRCEALSPPPELATDQHGPADAPKAIRR